MSRQRPTPRNQFLSNESRVYQTCGSSWRCAEQKPQPGIYEEKSKVSAARLLATPRCSRAPQRVEIALHPHAEACGYVAGVKPAPHPNLRGHRPLLWTNTVRAQVNNALRKRAHEAIDEPFAPRCRREVINGFVFAAKMAGARVTAVTCDFFERQGGPSHQLARFLQAQLSELRFRTGVPRLPEQPPEMTRGNVDRISHLFHRGAAVQVLGVPRKRALDFEIAQIGERRLLAAEFLSIEYEQREFSQRALKVERTGERRLTEMRLQLRRERLQTVQLRLG